MAAFQLRIRDCLITLVFCLNLQMYIVHAQNMPSLTEVEDWARKLSLRLRDDVNYTTGYKVLDWAYNNHGGNYQNLSAMKLEFEKLNATALVKEMAEKLEAMLASKMEALQTAVKAAEEAAVKHVFEADIKKDSVEYVNTKELLENDTRLVYSKQFHQKIIPANSSVHIPVEIYDGDIEILNGLKWTATLDDIFIKNAQKDPQILWQYFGSQTGFMRTWPGSKWNIGPDDVDLYDVRRRPWYTQGSSSPKDMFILIDSSGSVHGKALELVKVAVKSLLDTLGENDFVNIAMFAKEVSYISDCFNGSFAQATFRNKEILKRGVDDVKANGMADFKKAFSFAFEQLLQLRNQPDGSRGAGCNSMIMLFTDGGTDHAEEVFNEFNPKENMTFRVFTYAVGPTANPLNAIKWMACRNRGFFSQIPAMGAIRSKVQGLGMMTTVTLPVYNRTVGWGNQTILGVMGVDVTTAEMQKLEPKRKVGPNGFSYCINSNGDVVFHPGVRFSKALKDPPNVDFLDVEVVDDKKEKLRRDMIDMKKKTVELDTFRVAPDRNHVDPEKRIYSLTGLKQTDFSLGIALPKDQKYSLKVDTDISQFDKDKKLLNTTFTGLLIADWEYYKGNKSMENTTGTIADLEQAIRNPSQYDWGDKELINHLLWDISVTSFLNDWWVAEYQSPGSKMSSRAGMEATFVGTNGGLTRFYPKSCRYNQLVTRNFCTKTDQEGNTCQNTCPSVKNSEDIVDTFLKMRNVWDTNYYKRTISSPLYIFSAPYILEPDTGPNATASNVIVTKSVTMYNTTQLAPDLAAKGEKLDYKAAVVGANFTHQSILDRLKAVAINSSVDNCVNSDRLGCYLLDDGGFLITTNQNTTETSVGRFFGKVDPEVMYQLYDRTIYLRLQQEDYQATCSTESDDVTSAGTLSFNIPSMTLLYELLTFNWWSSVVTWTFANLNLYNMIFSSPENFAEAFIPEADTRSCVKKLTQYYFNPALDKVAGRTECEVRNVNCSRNYMAVRLAETNLLLVVSELEKPDCEPCRTLKSQEDLVQEAKETAPNICKVPPRYRRPTESCYDFDPREVKKCAGSLASPLSLSVLCLIGILTILVARR